MAFFNKTTKYSPDKKVLSIIRGDEDDDKIVTTITGKLKRFEQQSTKIRRQWLINSAMVRGQQFAVLHRTEDRLISLQAPPGRKLIMDNMIGPWRDHMIANMAMALPEFEGIPANWDSQSVTAARIAGALLNHYWSKWYFLYQYIQLTGYLIDFGNAFIYANYEVMPDKYRTEDAIDIRTGEIALDDDGTVKKVKRPDDDITCKVFLPHSIGCNLDPSPLEDKSWVTITERKELDYFSEKYENGDEVTGEAEYNSDSYDIQRISDVEKTNESSGYANETIYFQKPCDTNSDGFICIVSGNVLLKPKDNKNRQIWPYKKLMTYPIEHFHFPKESGEFFARSRVEAQIPLQKCLNLLWSIIMENAEEMGHIKILIPNTANVDSISDINEIIRYDLPKEPSYMTPSPLPDFISGTVIERLKSAIRDVQNYHGASLGGSVSGVRSDLHAQNLQEQDLLPLSTVDNLVKASFEKFGEKILLIAADKVKEERAIDYVGKDRRLQFINFKGAMLGDTQKVKVRMTNTQMRTKGATAQRIMEYYQAGLITDNFRQPDPVEAMRQLEFALPDSQNKTLRLHSDMAYRENDRMIGGEETWVLRHQDHMIHLNIHQEFQNSSDYMKLYEELKTNPQNKQLIQIFDNHVMQHNQLLMQAMGMLEPKPEEKEKTKETQSAKGSTSKK